MSVKESRKILIIDDSSEDRELFKIYIKQDPNYDDIFWEESLGINGLYRLRQERPDCVLLDFNLPDMDGLEILQEITGKDNYNHLPVIVLTGFGDEQVAVQSLKRGASDYLSKHKLDTETLNWTINRAIENSRLKQRLDEQYKQLQESEHRYKVLSEATLEGVVIHQNGILVEANQSAANLLGYNTPQDLVGKVVGNTLAPESLKVLQQQLAEDTEKPFEFFLVRKDGTQYPVERQSKEIEYNGKPARADIIRNITDRKLKEQQLKESEERYRVLSEATYEGLIIHDGQKIIEVNQRFADIYGYNREELIGSPLSMLMDPDYQLALQQRLANNFTERVFEGTGQRKDGSTFYIEARGKPIEYQGKPVRLAAIRDITELKEAENRINESQNRFKILSEATFEGVVIHRNGLVVEANQSAAILLGYSNSAELIGNHIIANLDPESIPLIQKQLEEGSDETLEINIVRKDGTQFPAETQGKNIEYLGQPARAGIFRDITDRKLKEQQLKESEERYRVLSEASYEGLCIFSEGLVVDANQRLAAMLGYTLEEYIGMPLEQLIPAPDLAAIKAQLAVNTKATLDTIALHKNGTVVPVEARGMQIEYRGRLARAVAIRDMTDLKLATKQLDESDYRYKVLSEAAFDGVVVYQAGEVVEANQSAANLLGYNNTQELLGRKIEDFIIPESLAFLRKMLTENPGKPFEIISIKKDGTLFNVETQLKTIDYHGQPALAGIIRDITDRKLKEQQLKDSEERYRILSEGSYEGLCIYINGNIVNANRRMAELLGYSLEEYIGMPLENLVAPQALPAMRERIAINSPKPADTIARHKNGTFIPVETRGMEIEYLGRKARAVAVRDLTEIKQAEEALEKTRNQLLQAQKMESVGRLAGGIAHDFNNLLTAIMGYGELAQLRLQPEEKISIDLAEIQKAAIRAADLTQQLLAFSRQQVLKPKIINLNDQVKDLVKLLHRLIGEDIILSCKLDPALEQTLIDPGQFDQVMMNLVVNARDAMPGGGKLVIETSNIELEEDLEIFEDTRVKAGFYVGFAVTDTGTGMDTVTQDQIFEPFYTTKEVGKGTGLGLSTVYGIVKQSGGYINVISEVGKGTTFKIYLPVYGDPRKAPKFSRVMSSRNGLALEMKSTGSKKTILVVEDEESVRKLIERTLSSAGYKTLIAKDGVEGLNMLEEYSGQIHLVLTDIIMPNMGGLVLIEQIKLKKQSAKLLCMSGYSNQIIDQKSTSPLYDSFIQKPFIPSALLRLVRETLEV